MFKQEDRKLIYKYDAEQVWVEPWGSNSIRVRATKCCQMISDNWALCDKPEGDCQIEVGEDKAELVNGKIRAEISKHGKIMIYNQRGEVLLEEYARNRKDLLDKKCSAIEVEAREFKPIVGGDYHLTARFESVDPNERIYGMGQYQQPFMNLKGVDLELAHRNSQASVPFALSSLGYGFLWNNPGVGRVVFGKNITSFEAFSTQSMDYWVTAGDTPAEIEEMYADVTGKVPMMPEYGLGFWQCKLRYQTQEELLKVARNAAEEVNANDQAAEADVAEALENLRAAMERLIPKPDKTALENLVQSAKGIDIQKYTEDTVKTFEESLKIAEDVLAAPEATQAEVDEAIASLQNAVEQLTEKQKPTDPADPNGGNKPGDGSGNGNVSNNGNGGNSGSSNGGGSGSTSVETGDTAPVAVLFAALFASAGVVLLMFRKRRYFKR